MELVLIFITKNRKRNRFNVNGIWRPRNVHINRIYTWEDIKGRQSSPGIVTKLKKMGAFAAPISHLLPSILNPKTPLILSKQHCQTAPKQPHKSSSITLSIQRRQLLLLSVPVISLTSFFQYNSRSFAAPIYDPVSPAERDASLSLSQRVSEAVSLLEKGRDLQAKGDFIQALQCFSQVPTFFFVFFGFACVVEFMLWILSSVDILSETYDINVSLVLFYGLVGWNRMSQECYAEL